MALNVHVAKRWKLLHRSLKLESPWVTVYSDRLLDDAGQELEYWHYDRADSVIVLVIGDGQVVLPAPQYRPGVDKVTLDFCGGRIGAGEQPADAARRLVDKELGISQQQIVSLQAITTTPLMVDSSFSSQQLYGFVLHVTGVAVPAGAQCYPLGKLAKLYSDLRCVQCRMVLGEYMLK